MTDQQHPVTPPPELVREWSKGCSPYDVPADHIATQAARWGADQQLQLDAEQINQAWQKGADQELEACCEVLRQKGVPAWSMLRSNRRPKPPSLKERALEALKEAVYMAEDSPPEGISLDQANIIRHALEQLDD